jgi:hypothetical protein
MALADYLLEHVLDPFQEFVAALYASSHSLPMVTHLLHPRARVLIDWARLLRSFQGLKGGRLLNALHEAKRWAFEDQQVATMAIQSGMLVVLLVVRFGLSSSVVE